MPLNLKLCFFGDDFTGSTDAMDSLARVGVKTILFTSPPTTRQLESDPGLQAFGIAGQTRAMPPDEMENHLRPAFAAMRDSGAALAHYKVCSTFDSSPEIGNIGRVIEIGSEVFAARTVPIVVGAPDLGRYCVFGNLFARYGDQPHPFRIDRHPSMSRHPVTPMDEGDLRIHLSKQSSRSISLFDVIQLNQAANQVTQAYDALLRESPDAVLFDTLYHTLLPVVGSLLDRRDTPFIVGSSGVESALTAHWQSRGMITGTGNFDLVKPNGPIIALCGSMSPITAGQIRHAIGEGFVEFQVDSEGADQHKTIAGTLANGKSVVIHTGGRNATISPRQRTQIGQSLGSLLHATLEHHPVNRVIIAGGDTSGEVARALKLESMEMIGELTRGAPLCRVKAPSSPADHLEMVFKGGQIGSEDFFSFVRNGKQPE